MTDEENWFIEDTKSSINNMSRKDLDERTKFRLEILRRSVTAFNYREILEEAKRFVRDDKYILEPRDIDKKKVTLRDAQRVLHYAEIVRIEFMLVLFVKMCEKYSTRNEISIITADILFIAAIMIASICIYALQRDIDYQQSLILLIFDE